MKKILTFFAIASFTSVFSQITINANFPSNMSSASSVDADVKINKGAVGNFAKYQLDVPAGYVISAVDAKGGNFTFENQRAKIVWVSVPSEPEFTIKLKVQANSDATNPATFSQKFYYLENNEKKEVEAAPIIINIGGGSAVAATSTPVETKSTPVETNPVTTTTPVETKSTPVETTPVTTTTPVETKSTPVETTPVTTTKPVETKSTPVETTPVTTTKPVETKAKTSSSVGMTYKVQLGAYSNQPSKGKFSGAGSVSIDLINGMYKVTTGNFKTLDEAIKYRDELKTKGFDGFIAKYKDGVRIN